MKEFIEKLIERLKEISVENTCSDCPYKAKCDEVQERINDETTDLCGATIKALSIEIVNQLAEEYKGGWIPCSERLPEKNDSVLCWAKSTARGGDVCFVGSCHNGFWFLQSSADTHSFPGQYVIVAWKPIEPYQKGGE